MSARRKRMVAVLAGVLAGASAIVLVTALLTAAYSSRSANDRTQTLSHELGHALARLDQVSADADADRAQAAEERAVAARTRARLLARTRHQQAQLDAVVKYLREQGLPLPPALTQSRPGPSTRPKAHRRPSSPGTPTPTEPRPRNPSPSPNLPCQLVPALCIGLPLDLPTLTP